MESICLLEASAYQSKNALHGLQRRLESSLLRVPLKVDLFQTKVPPLEQDGDLPKGFNKQKQKASFLLEVWSIFVYNQNLGELLFKPFFLVVICSS